MESLYVVKIGGNIIDDQSSLREFLKVFSRLEGKKILVHGGGKLATDIGAQLGIQARKVDGRRITDRDTLRLVQMVYGGLINKDIVAMLRLYGCHGIGLTGADAGVIQASQRPVRDGVDYGYVGDITPDSVNRSFLRMLLEQGITPVFAPLTYSPSGSMLNTNADTIAGVLAVALAANYSVKLVYCFEKEGVIDAPSCEGPVIPLLTRAVFEEKKEAGIITEGMLPKLENAFDALRQGVYSVTIGHAADISLLVQDGAGTRIVSGT